jgi:hypothetical protein
VRVSRIILVAALAVQLRASPARADVHTSEPSDWTGPEVYQILNNSPWSKTLKVDVPGPAADSFGNQNTANTNSNAGALPPGAGGVGRRGMGGGGRTQHTYSSGSGSSGGSNARTGPTEVTIQWQSALVVRMAAAKKAGDKVDQASFKPLDEYVIAIIGLPITAVGGPAASADSNNTLTQDEQQRVEDRVKSSAALLRSGHQPLTPNKIELDQGKDGRMLLHFPKSDPLERNDKSVEFRLQMTRGELRKKFPLKEMEYQGKLQL